MAPNNHFSKHPFLLLSVIVDLLVVRQACPMLPIGATELLGGHFTGRRWRTGRGSPQESDSGMYKLEL